MTVPDSPPPGAPPVTTPSGGAEPDPRRLGLFIVILAFALLTLNSWGQFVLAALGQMGQPRLLTILHLLGGAAAYAAAYGTWRRRRWAAWAALSWGVILAVLIVAVGPTTGMPPEERRGLIPGALSVLMIGGGLGLYLRNAIRPRTR